MLAMFAFSLNMYVRKEIAIVRPMEQSYLHVSVVCDVQESMFYH
jgi:hypothetical protein